MDKHLCYAEVDAVPYPEHPQFWKIDSALLQIWFYCDAEDQALERVALFCTAARWQCREVRRMGLLIEEKPANEYLLEQARAVGISCRVLGVRTGGDPSTHPQGSEVPGS